MKSECPIIDSDSDSCCSSNYDEEQDAEYDRKIVDNEDKDRKDDDKGKEHNQYDHRLENDGDNGDEEPMAEDNVKSFKEGNRSAERRILQTTTEPHPILETDISLANVEMQHDSVIATGQHHIWI